MWWRACVAGVMIKPHLWSVWYTGMHGESPTMQSAPARQTTQDGGWRMEDGGWREIFKGLQPNLPGLRGKKSWKPRGKKVGSLWEKKVGASSSYPSRFFFFSHPSRFPLAHPSPPPSYTHTRSPISPISPISHPLTLAR